MEVRDFFVPHTLTSVEREIHSERVKNPRAREKKRDIYWRRERMRDTVTRFCASYCHEYRPRDKYAEQTVCVREREI